MTHRFRTILLLFVTSLVSACDEAPSGPVTKAPAVVAAAEAQDSAGQVIKFSFGGEQQEFPAVTCMITPLIVSIAGQQGETVVDLLYDGRAKVGYRRRFERDSVRYQDQWNSKRDDLKYSVDDNIVTASGTMRHAGRWQQVTQSRWTDTGFGLLGDQPFTFSATCN